MRRAKESLTLAFMCTDCTHLPEDAIVWFAVSCHGKRKKSFQKMASTSCANCGMKYDSNSFNYFIRENAVGKCSDLSAVGRLLQGFEEFAHAGIQFARPRREGDNIHKAV